MLIWLFNILLLICIFFFTTSNSSLASCMQQPYSSDKCVRGSIRSSVHRFFGKSKIDHMESSSSLSSSRSPDWGVFCLRVQGGFDVWADNDDTAEEAPLQSSRTAKAVRKAAR